MAYSSVKALCEALPATRTALEIQSWDRRSNGAHGPIEPGGSNECVDEHGDSHGGWVTDRTHGARRSHSRSYTSTTGRMLNYPDAPHTRCENLGNGSSAYGRYCQDGYTLRGTLYSDVDCTGSTYEIFEIQGQCQSHGVNPGDGSHKSFCQVVPYPPPSPRPTAPPPMPPAASGGGAIVGVLVGVVAVVGVGAGVKLYMKKKATMSMGKTSTSDTDSTAELQL